MSDTPAAVAAPVAAVASSPPSVTPDTPIQYTRPDGSLVDTTFRELTNAHSTRPAIDSKEFEELQELKKAWAGDPVAIHKLTGTLVPKDPTPVPGSPDAKFMELTQEIEQLKSLTNEQKAFKESITQQAEIHRVKQALGSPELAKVFPVLNKIPDAANQIYSRYREYEKVTPNAKDPNIQRNLYQQAITDVNNYAVAMAKALGIDINALAPTSTTPTPGSNISVVNDRGTQANMEPARYQFINGQMVDTKSPGYQAQTSVPPSAPVIPPVGSTVPPMNVPPVNQRMTVSALAEAMRARKNGFGGGM